MTTGKMKAVVRREYGGPERFQVEELSIPTPKAEEVLIRLCAVSLNLSDWEGLVGSPFYVRIFGLFRPRLPILGSDLVGTVEAVGTTVKRFRVGDDVYCDALGLAGGFAEYACVPERIVMKKPETLSFEQVSTVPQAGIIAFQGLGRGENIGPGTKVLINGAGGGSGMFAIQMAKSWGAEVTAVDRGLKRQHMLALGADHVIDYEMEDFAKNGVRYDWILDLVGTRSVSACAGALSQGGVYQMVGGTMSCLFQTLLLGPLFGLFGKKRLGVLGANANETDFARILEMMERGVVKVVIDRIYRLAEAPEAVLRVGEGKSMGKLVVSMP